MKTVIQHISLICSYQGENVAMIGIEILQHYGYLGAYRISSRVQMDAKRLHRLFCFYSLYLANIALRTQQSLLCGYWSCRSLISPPYYRRQNLFSGVINIPFLFVNSLGLRQLISQKFSDEDPRNRTSDA